MYWGRKCFTFFILILLIAALIPLLNFPNAVGDLRDPLVLKNHNRIHISKNNEINKTNGVTTGNGTKNDPYIIENWSIEATSSTGIWIDKTDANLLIRNCYIFNKSTSPSGYGFRFSNLKNITIENCRINNTRIGIYLYRSTIKILNTTIENGRGEGFYAFESNNVIIINSTIKNNKESGIYFKNSCSDIVIEKCTLFNNGEYGLYLSGNRNSIIDNQIIQNKYNGAYITGTNLNFINNTVHNNSLDGVAVSFSNSNFAENRIFNNKKEGLKFRGSNINLHSNIIYDNWKGLILNQSTNINFYNNSISNNSFNFGIIGDNFENYNHSIPVNNTINGKPIYYWIDKSNLSIPNDAGFIGLVKCDNISIKNFNFTNLYQGILVISSTNNIIENNTLFKNYYGIYLDHSSDSNLIRQNILDKIILEGIVVKHSEVNEIMNNTIHSSMKNGIVVIGSKSNIIQYNKIFNNQNYGFYLSYSENTKMVNNICSNNTYGIYVSGSPNYNKICQNLIKNNHYGVYLFYGNNYFFADNIIQNNSETGLTITNNRNSRYFNNIINSNKYNLNLVINSDYYSNNSIPPNNTVNGKPIYYWEEESNQTIPINAGYIGLLNCDNITIKNVELSHNYQGINLISTKNITFENNTISNSYYCIHLKTSSTKNNINYNSLNNSVRGIHVEYSNDNVISFNTIFNNTIGILTYGSFKNLVNNNSINRNDVGMSLGYPDEKNIIKNNLIFNNTDGISPGSSRNNLIYNNYFNNINNYQYWASFDNNIWNISRTKGINIIGGPYQGGNYWSNYTGKDTNGDGLGNTKLPYGLGDLHPLCYLVNDITAPIIEDNTSGEPSTGESFYINAIVTDFTEVKNVFLKYWLNQYPSENTTVTRISGNAQNGSYSKTIDILSSTFKLNYIISSQDFYNNWRNTKLVILNVTDNDRPYIEDLTISNATTGENFYFNISAMDNIDIFNVFVKYQINEGPVTNISLSYQDNTYKNVINLPSNAISMIYTISAVDTSNNWASLMAKSINIIDNDGPEIIDQCLTPENGEKYKFKFSITDNFKVSTVYLEYWFDSENHENVTLNIKFEYEIEIPINVFILYVKLTAIDHVGNLNQLILATTISDKLKPTIDDFTADQPEMGKLFYIECEVTENLILKSVEIEYWFNTNEHFTNSMLLKDTEIELEKIIPFNKHTFYYELNIPLDTYNLIYIITAIDVKNNSVSIIKDIEVMDTIPPMIMDFTNTTPFTGDEFEIKANITDNILIKQSYLEYWFDEGKHFNISFQDNITINIDSNSKLLYYTIFAEDFSDNSNLSQKIYEIIDNDQPLIEDLTLEPTTGDIFEFKVNFYENIEITKSLLIYNFNEEEPITIDFNGSYKIEIPDAVRVLKYTIFVEDRNNNSNQLEKILTVIDNDHPIIIDHSYSIENGYRFTIEIIENIELKEVRVDYWFEDQSANFLILYLGKEYFEGTISIPKTENKLFYMISAEDISGNKANSDIIEEDIEEAPKQIIDLGEGTFEILIIVLIIVIISVMVVIVFLYKRGVKKQLFSKGQTVKPLIHPSQDTEDPINTNNSIQTQSGPNIPIQTQTLQQPQKIQYPVISKTENSNIETTGQSNSNNIQQEPQFARSTKLLPPMVHGVNKDNLKNISSKKQTQIPSEETRKVD